MKELLKTNRTLHRLNKLVESLCYTFFTKMAKLYNFRASGNPVDTDSSRKKGSRSKNFFHDDSSQLLSSPSPENGSIFYDGFMVHIYKDVQNCSTFNSFPYILYNYFPDIV